MKPKRQKGSLFPSEWGNRDIASAAKEVTNNPLNKIASNSEGFLETYLKVRQREMV